MLRFRTGTPIGLGGGSQSVLKTLRQSKSMMIHLIRGGRGIGRRLMLQGKEHIRGRRDQGNLLHVSFFAALSPISLSLLSFLSSSLFTRLYLSATGSSSRGKNCSRGVSAGNILPPTSLIPHNPCLGIPVSRRIET